MRSKIIRTALALAFVGFLITAPQLNQLTAQTAATKVPENRIALYQALLDLTNPWTVMCIAAHPDDEDGTSLIVMRRKYGAHTVSLFSTFGEGGQNAIGPELYEEMGAIRARETIAAAEIQGSEPHFLGLKDFGYSKSADEAFRFWGHDEALRRMVLEIRKLRPDVIITNHSATSNDHGHHQATARLELEAFDAAADPTRFPEQLKDGVTTWQVQRLFVRNRGNQAQADSSGIVTIDPNEQDPVRGVVYAEEALRALQKHATQGPWPKTFAEMIARFTRNSGDGKMPLTRYLLTKEAKGAAPLPKDSHNFLDGLHLPEGVASQLALPKIDLNADADQSRILDQLTKGFSNANYRTPNQSTDLHRFLIMKQRAEQAFALAGGIDLQVEPSTRVVTPGGVVDLKVNISDTGTQPARVSNCQSPGTGTSPTGTSVPASLQIVNAAVQVNRTQKFTIPANARINLPQSAHLYDGAGLGIDLVVRCSIEVGGSKFELEKSTRVDVAPPVEIADVSPAPALLTPGGLGKTSTKKLSFTVRLTNHQTTAFDGNLIAASGITHEQTDRLAVKLAAGESRTVTLMVQTPPPGSGPANPVTFLLQSATVSSPSRVVPVINVDERTAGNLRVGYLRGFDFSLPQALNALGVESKELSVADVKTADLQKYTSIVVDNRVYESQPDLIAVNQKLLDYANGGGTLIVFYHKSNEWNPDPRRNRPDQLAPLKLILGDERITDETAPITFLEPQHPLLNLPNKMGQEDFAGWIQERGLYYPKDWDPQFHALLQSNDPGEAPLKGGLLVADYGRGHYIYTSMVWYRELRGGIPGAYRMLANMISYGQK